MPPRPSARAGILAALRTILVRDGVGAVTLEAVAAEAGVSKGGLLYHFPSKDALLAGLLSELEQVSAARLAAAADEPGGVARFYLEASLPQGDERELFWSVLAALRSSAASDTAASAALRTFFDSWSVPLRASVADPVLAEIIRLVGDGIFLDALVGVDPPSPALHHAVVTRLLGLLADGDRP